MAKALKKATTTFSAQARLSTAFIARKIFSSEGPWRGVGLEVDWRWTRKISSAPLDAIEPWQYGENEGEDAIAEEERAKEGPGMMGHNSRMGPPHSACMPRPR